MSTGATRGAPELPTALGATKEAIERSLSVNDRSRLVLEHPKQAVDFAWSLFRDIDNIRQIATFPFDPETKLAVDFVEESLRAIRVAALAVEDTNADLARPTEQAERATSALNSGLELFLDRLRAFLTDVDEDARRRYVPILDRYGEQLEAKQLVEEVRETRDEAKRVLSDTRRAAGATGESRLAQHFGKYAYDEQRLANRLRLWCVTTLLSIVAVATGLVLASSELSTARELARLAVTIPLAVLATYLGGEATRHRRVARRARELEIQLETVDAFTHPLPDELRDKLRIELGQQVFSGPPTDEDGGPVAGPSVVGDAGVLIEKVADLLKAAAASRSD